ncbi:MAG: DUF309 domain-containing protein [Terriglobia bacterium]
MTHAIARGIRLFNEHRFFEAHEALEEIWLKEHGEAKTFLHGLIQIAAAFHHYTRANLPGFRSLMNKGCKKLDVCGDQACGAYGLDLAAFQQQLKAWRQFLIATENDPGSKSPPLPQIVIRTGMP